MGYITDWRTSTRTQGQGQCVEVGFGSDRIGVRDSKNRAAGHVTCTQRQWQLFTEQIKRGGFDA
ncbi:hypothetical protein GCM10027174_00010 [Salinifilum aidingensis]